MCVPELEQVRVAQILTISSELAQAYKWATADPALKRALNRETRFSLMAAARFSATDYLQARITAHYLPALPCPCFAHANAGIFMFLGGVSVFWIAECGRAGLSHYQVHAGFSCACF